VTQCAHCFKPKVDGTFPRSGRTACRKEPPCGLHVIGAQRIVTRRIDEQLQARAGRQGDPGSSRFFVALQDDVMKFVADDSENLGRLPSPDEEGIEDRRISRAIKRAQNKAEKRGFELTRMLNQAERPATS